LQRKNKHKLEKKRGCKQIKSLVLHMDQSTDATVKTDLLKPAIKEQREGSKKHMLHK
tara:strand:- start:599 stop:769 length:171 start_codon:yes stop_codon:yes gene_type:complete